MYDPCGDVLPLARGEPEGAGGDAAPVDDVGGERGQDGEQGSL